MPTPVRVGDVIDIDLERAATGGAVGRAAGVVTFVRFALPGERVRATVTEVARSYQRAAADEIVSASADRVTPPCPYAAAQECGGCGLQHATDAAQRAWKASVAEEHLRRIAHTSRVLRVHDAGAARGSRTRLRCGVIDGRLGLRRARSHDIVPLERCWIADDRFEAAFAHTWEDATAVELRAIGSGDPFAVVAGPNGEVRVTSLDGQPRATATSTVHVRGRTFEVGPQSFWQNHRLAPETLTAAVLSQIPLDSDRRVVDLYGGVGLFGISVAHADPRRSVTVVEHSAAACRDARTNARDLPAVTIVESSVTGRSVRDTVRVDDVVIVDPPRTGIPAGSLDALVSMRPSRVIYVSCDAATFARDLSRLMVAGYVLGSLETFDLFPMTEHLELVAVLDDEAR